jgi:drug/metabolite transporter (DMT)-like permease
MTTHNRGLLIGFVTVLLFGITVVLQAFLVEEGIKPFAAVGIRYLVAALVCLVIVVITRRSILPVKGERIPAVLLGAFVYGLQAVLFYSALGYGSVASVSLLFYTYPVLALVASLALGLRRWSWVAGGSAGLSVVGAALVVATGHEVAIEPVGVVMALGSACCVAVFLLANKRLIPLTPAIVSATWVSFGVAVTTLMLALLLGEWETLSARAWLILLVSGALTGLGTAGMYVVLALLGPAPTSVLLSLQTVVAILGSALLLGQSVLAGQLIGGVAILGAIALMAFAARRQPGATFPFAETSDVERKAT